MIDSINKLVRPNIYNLVAYKSARSEFKGKADVFVDANENPISKMFNRYPDPLQTKLKTAIGNWRNIDPSCIMIGNGSDEIIDLLIRIFANPGIDSVYSFKPGFGMYSVASALNDVNYFEYPLDEKFALNVDEFLDHIPDSCKIIFLTSPNNPTGTSIPRKEIMKVLKRSNCIVVVDEAYIDFSPFESTIDLIDHHNNLVVLQTFSKALGSAGLRVGMAFSNLEIIKLLNKVKMPYNVSEVSQKLALDKLLDIKTIGYEKTIINEEKRKLYECLKNNRLVEEVFLSDANFFLVRFIESEKIYKYLLGKGIVVRNQSTKFGCHNCLRISIGSPAENILIADSLEELAST